MTSAATAFGAKTTAQEVVKRFTAHVSGRTFLITGSAAGIGLETARALASAGGKVTVAARSQAQAEKAVDEIRTALGAQGPGADLSALELDLSSIESIKKGAAAFMQRVPKLNVLINNAGVMASPFSTTKDGLEQQFGVNHVGHHLLTSLLMPALIAAGTPFVPSRVVNLSSLGHYLTTDAENPIDFDNLEARAETYKEWTRYGESKLMNVLHATELTRRCAEAKQPVIGVSLHPGAIVATKLARYIGLASTFRMASQLSSWWAVYAGVFVAGFKNIPQGASTTLVCALDPAVQPGKYYRNCQVDKAWVHKQVYNPELAKRLWDFTEELLKRKTDEAGPKK